MPETFSSKWKSIEKDDAASDVDERSLFVPPGQEPITQRQINLYNYFLFNQKILRAIGAKDVIEIGCGRGTSALYIAAHMGLPVSLLDIEPDAIAIAKCEFGKYNQAATYYLADVLSTGIPDVSYDAVISVGLAEHFEDVDALFAEQYRLLRKGGVMISLNIPKKFSVQSLNIVMRFFKKLFGAYKESLRKDYYRNNLKPNDFRAAAKRVGFKNVSITHVCPFPIYVPIAMSTDRRIATFNKWVLWVRSLFQKYPFKTNALVAQAHFLVGYKK